MVVKMVYGICCTKTAGVLFLEVQWRCYPDCFPHKSLRWTDAELKACFSFRQRLYALISVQPGNIKFPRGSASREWNSPDDAELLHQTSKIPFRKQRWYFKPSSSRISEPDLMPEGTEIHFWKRAADITNTAAAFSKMPDPEQLRHHFW